MGLKNRESGMASRLHCRTTADESQRVGMDLGKHTALLRPLEEQNIPPGVDKLVCSAQDMPKMLEKSPGLTRWGSLESSDYPSCFCHRVLGIWPFWWILLKG